MGGEPKLVSRDSLCAWRTSIPGQTLPAPQYSPIPSGPHKEFFNSKNVQLCCYTTEPVFMRRMAVDNLCAECQSSICGIPAYPTQTHIYYQMSQG